MVFLLSNLTIVKVCADEVQAFYHADILKLKEYFVHDVAMSSFEVFSTHELGVILCNHNNDANAVAKWDREVRLGALLNLCNSIEPDETGVAALHGKLKRAPEAPQIVNLTHAQREKQMGPANTTRTVQNRAGSSTAQKRPKPGSTTARVWDVADAAMEGFSDVNDKQLRDTVVQQCVGEGINISTARTQFGHWKRDKLCA